MLVSFTYLGVEIKMSSSNKISLGTFIGIGMAMIATVRSVPTLAAASWQNVLLSNFLLLFSLLLPVSIMSGEFSSMLHDVRWSTVIGCVTGLGFKIGDLQQHGLLWVADFPRYGLWLLQLLGPLLGNYELVTKYWD